MQALVGRIKIAVVIALLSVLAQASGAMAQVLELRSGDVQLAQDAVTVDAVKTGNSPSRYIIQLSGPMSPDREKALQAAGVALGDYLPRHAYFAELSRVDKKKLAALDFVESIAPLQKAWRIAPPLLTLHKQVTAMHTESGQPRAVQRSISGASQPVAVSIVTFAGTSAADAVKDLSGINGLVVNNAVQGIDRAYVDAVVPPAKLMEVATAPSVQYVDRAPVGGLRNAVTTAVVQSGTDVDTPVWDHGIGGQNQIIGLIDATPKEAHCFFNDTEPIGPTHRKFIAFRPPSPPPNHSHGTFVAGVLAGDDVPWGEPNGQDGIAYAAKISYSDYFAVYGSPATFIDRLTDAHNDGAHIHSNSWGDDSTTAYTIWSRQADEFSYYNEDDLVCFAVSNTSYLRTPENAKNVVSIGASHQYPSHDQICYGGQGPTADGRRKPDIFAPGCGVRSADVNTTCGTISGSGTSYSCPAVAASAVLVRQYYLEGFYPYGERVPEIGFVPSGALIKATLLNGAVDMTGVPGYPTDREGWGRLVLDRALKFRGDSRRLALRDVRNADGLTTAESYAFKAYVWDASEDLRVTMVFTDPPAAVNAANPVINNLDLMVTDRLGDAYFGNVIEAGWSVTGGDFDPINNVEQVLIQTPLRGKYTIEVFATEVNSPAPQGFAVVVSGGLLERAKLRTLTMGDADLDGDRDLRDLAELQRCLGTAFDPLDSRCTYWDADDDGDVDLSDFQLITPRITGPQSPPRGVVVPAVE